MESLNIYSEQKKKFCILGQSLRKVRGAAGAPIFAPKRMIEFDFTEHREMSTATCIDERIAKQH